MQTCSYTNKKKWNQNIKCLIEDKDIDFVKKEAAWMVDEAYRIMGLFISDLEIIRKSNIREILFLKKESQL